jgi:hypothetical protein
MGKCIKCGKETANAYTVKASIRVARSGYSDTYEPVETVSDYACTGCVVKSRFGSFVFFSVCALFVVIAAYSVNLSAFIALGVMAAGFNWLRYFILTQNASADEIVVNNACWGSKLVAKYHAEALRERHPGCNILYVNPAQK